MTLSVAYNAWIKKYPQWKMERPIPHCEGILLLNSETSERRIFIFIRSEIVSSADPTRQLIFIPQNIIDPIISRAIQVVIAYRSNFYLLLPQAVYDRYEERKEIGGEKMYGFYLSKVGAINITNGEAMEQQKIDFAQ